MAKNFPNLEKRKNKNKQKKNPDIKMEEAQNSK